MPEDECEGWKTHPKEEDYCNIEENGGEQNSIIGAAGVYVWSR